MICSTNKYLSILLSIAGLLFFGSAKGESATADSLSLSAIIGEVVQNHPLVKKTMEEINVADAKIGYTQSNYRPSVDFTSSYSRIGPVSEVTIPSMGTFSFMPKDNYNASINVNQTIYDFGKTAKNVMLEKQSKELYLKTVEQVKQKLSQAAIGTYFALVYLQEAIKIKDEQLSTLN